LDGAGFGWVDLQTLHSLASSENMEQVSQQLGEVDKFCTLRDVRWEYWQLSAQDWQVPCKKKNQYVPLNTWYVLVCTGMYQKNEVCTGM
jgi:hypothetical protein